MSPPRSAEPPRTPVLWPGLCGSVSTACEATINQGGDAGSFGTSTACFEETRYGSKTAEKRDLFTRELVRLCALCGMPRQQERSCYGHSRHPRPNESWRHFLVNGTGFDGLGQWMTEGAPCPSH